MLEFILTYQQFWDLVRHSFRENNFEYPIKNLIALEAVLAITVQDILLSEKKMSIV